MLARPKSRERTLRPPPSLPRRRRQAAARRSLSASSALPLYRRSLFFVASFCPPEGIVRYPISRRRGDARCPVIRLRRYETLSLCPPSILGARAPPVVASRVFSLLFLFQFRRLVNQTLAVQVGRGGGGRKTERKNNTRARASARAPFYLCLSLICSRVALRDLHR